MKALFTLILVILLLILNACTPEDSDIHNIEYISLIWKKYFYNNVEETVPYCTDFYQYDSLYNLERICSCAGSCPDTNNRSKYIYYRYNGNKQLQYQLTYYYWSDQLGWIVIDSTNFTYENNQLMREEYWWHTNHLTPATVILYEYEGSLIRKKSSYNNNLFESCITYEYRNNICIKESYFASGSIMEPESYTIHIYNNGLKIRSESYSYEPNKAFQIINYSYNKLYELVLEESIILDPERQVPLPYVYRYEYMKVPVP
ncbi:MAG: hypothetical protein U0T82_02660 [Bacteroidales bacterium]